VVETIEKAYQSPDEYKSIKRYLKSQPGKEYAVIMDFSYPLKRENGKLVTEPIVNEVVFTVVERANYDKAYGPIKGNI